MPLSTRPFFTDNPGDIPYEYVVPATVELRVQSIVARFDGSGASGEFYPCLAIYTQDDHLLARIRTDQKFAIGDTGVVTWGPFLRQAAAGTPGPPGTSSPVEWVAYTSLTNWAAGLTTLSFTEIGGAYDAGPPTFGLSGGQIQVKKAGFYLAYLMPYNFDFSTVAETVVDIRFNRSAGPTPGSYRPMTGHGVRSLILASATSPITLDPQPMDTFFFSYGAGVFGATPTTFDVVAIKYVAGVATADVGVITRVGLARLGDEFV